MRMPQVRGAPKEADGGQRHVGGKLRMAHNKIQSNIEEFAVRLRV